MLSEEGMQRLDRLDILVRYRDAGAPTANGPLTPRSEAPIHPTGRRVVMVRKIDHLRKSN